MIEKALERNNGNRKKAAEQFCNLGIYESNVVDTTNYSIQETVSAVQERIASRAALLS